MKRIFLMVLTNILHVPWWFHQIDKMGKNPEQYSEEERYHYLRKRLRRINRRGRVFQKQMVLFYFQTIKGFLIC